MYEKITSFVDFFENNAVSEGELKKQIEKFANAFMESEFMHLNAMEEMGDAAEDLGDGVGEAAQDVGDAVNDIVGDGENN